MEYYNHSDKIFRFSEHGPTLDEVLETTIQSGQMRQAKFLVIAGSARHDDMEKLERTVAKALERHSREPLTRVHYDYLQLASEGRDPRSRAMDLLRGTESFHLISIHSLYRSFYNPSWGNTFLRTLLSGQPGPGKLLLFLSQDQLHMLNQTPEARSGSLIFLQG